MDVNNHKKCDLCHKFYDVSPFSNMMGNGVNAYSTIEVYGEKYDLCPYCTSQLEAWLKSKKKKEVIEYKGYELRSVQGVQYPFKPRPYDNAAYYGASSIDGLNWTIRYNGIGKPEKFVGDFYAVVDALEKLNKDIKPIICHN